MTRGGANRARRHACLCCCALLLLAVAGICPRDASAYQKEALTLNGSTSLLSSDDLVTPAAEVLLGEQGEQAAEGARLASPSAAVARERSRSEFADMSTGGIVDLLGRAFPEVVDANADGSPLSPPSGKVERFLAANVARIGLPGGRHGVLWSATPLAKRGARGQWSGLDLALQKSPSGFSVANPLVGIRLPSRVDDGVSLAGEGLTLSPSTGSGSPAGGSPGVLDGSSVLYADTGRASDTLVQPTALGFDEDSVLRAATSPRVLYYKVGLPAGARLVRRGDVVGVVREGTVLAEIVVGGAFDAVGSRVPIAVGVSGDVLRVGVEDGGEGVQFPVIVDPAVTVHDTTMAFVHEGYSGNWAGHTEGKGLWAGIDYAEGGLEVGGGGEGNGEYSAGGNAFLQYGTQGESHIYEFSGNVKEEEPATGIRGDVFIESAAHKPESSEAVFPTSGEGEQKVCVSQGCAAGSVTASDESNLVTLDARVTESGSTQFDDKLLSSSVGIVQEAAPSVHFDTSESTIDERPNALYGSGRWVSTRKYEGSPPAWEGMVALDAFDPGIGIWHGGVGLVGKAKSEALPWPAEPDCNGVQCNECFEPECTTKAKGVPIGFLLHDEGELPEGEDTIEGLVEDQAGLTANTGHATIKVDNTPPYGISLSGLPEDGEINEQVYHLQGQASDARSGVASIELELDGVVVGKASGSCSGACTAKSEEWAFSAENVGAGEHTLTVVATDLAGNVATASYPVHVRHPQPVSAGPGSVNPTTGQLYLSATDVSVGGPGASLTVSRSYGSRDLTAGVEGPLGPQWSLSLGAEQQLVPGAGGSVTLEADNGGLTTFTSNGKGEFDPPRGDGNLLLSEVKEGEKVKEYLLRDATVGTTTRFTQPAGSESSAPYRPSISEGAVATDTQTYSFQSAEVEGKKITEPVQELAPVPSGVSCSPTLERGCRALSFSYATATTASGEAPAQWGEYKGRLVRVSFTAWSPAKAEMVTNAVAEYAYDSKGRLRAEWDPMISPALKTTYGYDAEGHVTALSTAGQQPWLFGYGTIPADGTPGRLLSLTRPAASTALGNGQAPVDSAVPTLSSSEPAVGRKIGVSSNGTWSEAPLAYAYQWEDCNGSGAECTPIPGAVNASYYPVKSDEGHTLRALVLAANAGGSVSAQSAATHTVATGTPNSPAPEAPAVGSNAVWTLEYEVPVSGSGAPYALGSKEAEAWAQSDDPSEAMAIFPPDEPMGWPAANYRRASVHYLDSDGRAVNLASPGGGIGTSEYNTDNDVVRTLSADDRAQALKEGSKSSEDAKLWDTKSTYGAEGSELLETLGPQHKIKLATGGSEVLARERTRYLYNEGAPSEGGPYHLVTKMIDGADVQGQDEEKEVRVTSTAYSGQSNLGWKLREPTAVTVDPDNALLGTMTGEFGSLGSGDGQLKEPHGVATNASGDVYVADTKNNRVQEFSASGEYLALLGASGSETEKLSAPVGVAVASNGDVYAVSSECDCVKEYGSKGEYVRDFTAGDVARPAGIAFSAKNSSLYVVGESRYEGSSADAVSEFSESGTLTKSFGLEGAPGSKTCEELECYLDKPQGIAVSSVGDVYVASTGNDQIVEFNPEGTFIKEFGEKGSGAGQLKEPKGIAVASNGNLYALDPGNDRVQEFTSKGEYLAQFGSEGSGNGQLKQPVGIAVTASGTVYVADTANSRMEEWGGSSTTGLNLVHSTVYEAQSAKTLETRTPAAGAVQAEGAYTYTYKAAFGDAGSGEVQFNDPRAEAVAPNDDLYVADTKNNRVQELSPSGEYITQLGGSEGSGKLKEPESVVVNSEGDVYVADTGEDYVKEYNPKGEYVREFGSGSIIALALNSEGNVVALRHGSSATVTVYSPTGSTLKTLEEEDKHSSEEDVREPKDIAAKSGIIYITNTGEDGVQEYYESDGLYYGGFGTKGSGNGELKEPQGITIVHDGDIYVTDTGNDRVQEFSKDEAYLAQYGSKGTGAGELEKPSSVAFGANGHMFVADAGNNRIEKWTAPGEHASPTQTIYYSASANYAYPTCGEHPEWADLACQVQPTEQPEDSLPRLTVTDYTYNIWDQPEKTTETTGTATRTTTVAYEESGRALSKETTATTGTALPKVSYGYQKETGALIKESTTVEGKEEALTSNYNTLGQPTSYTDASENTASYEYDVDGRVTKVADGKGSQTYTYEETTGALTKLVDSAAGTFTATYDTEGNILTEGYPNGMTAYYTYNAVGKPVALEYKKLTHCTENCTWFTDSVVPSIHGQWLEQTSSLSHQAYTYDEIGRLTQVQNTPTGQGCTTHLYTYNEETDRTSLTTREPNSKSECSNEGGTVENHTYDEANRLTDEGTTYNAFGDTTSLPAADANKSTLTSSYYVDNQLQSQTQNGQTIGYNLDPAGRTRETVQTGTKTADTILHYDSSGSSPSWTSNTAGESTRNIPGINGALAAVQTDSEAPVLQLQNLHGDIIATAYLSETATGLATKQDTGEYGVPTNSLPPKYSWLGAIDLPTELPSGVIAMGARFYVPQLGRFLQPDPRPGGSADAYSYTFGDPVNTSDPSGEYTMTISAGAIEAENQRSEQDAAEVRRANEEAAARLQAEREAQWAAERAAREAGPQYGGGEEAGPNWLCEIAANTGQTVEGCGGGGGGAAGGVIWEAAGCSGTSACAASLDVLGFKVDMAGIDEWWKQVKGGFELVKETYATGLAESFKENSTVCKAVGYALAASSFFIPETRFTQALGTAAGFAATYSC